MRSVGLTCTKSSKADVEVTSRRVRAMAEREGFEPPVPLQVRLISSQVHSTGLCHLSASRSAPATQSIAERSVGLHRRAPVTLARTRDHPSKAPQKSGDRDYRRTHINRRRTQRRPLRLRAKRRVIDCIQNCENGFQNENRNHHSEQDVGLAPFPSATRHVDHLGNRVALPERLGESHDAVQSIFVRYAREP
jgi:hypothetical protein